MKAIFNKKVQRTSSRSFLLFPFLFFYFVFLISFLLVTNSIGQTSKTNVPFSVYANITYAKRSNSTYSHGVILKVGYELIAGLDNYKYRTGLSYGIGNIPSNATIDACRIFFASGNELNGATDGRLVFTKLRFDFPTIPNDETVYNLIKSGARIDSANIDAQNNYTVSLSGLKQDIQNAIQSPYPYIGIGVFNRYENSNGGTSFSGPTLYVDYTVPTPPAPLNLRTSSVTSSGFLFEWNASSGNVTGYKVYRNGSYYSTTSSTSMTFSGLCPATGSNLHIIPYNSYGDGDQSSTVSCTTLSPQITGPLIICSSGTALSISNLPSNSSIEWTAGQNITRSSAQGSNPCTFTATGNGSGTISATISTTGCSTSNLGPGTIWAGTPILEYITAESGGSGYTGQSSAFAVWPPNSHFSNPEPVWYVYPYANIWYNQNSYAQIQWAYAGTYEISAYAYNTCGSSNTVYYSDFYVYDYFFSISPNPASSEITVTINKNQSEKLANSKWTDFIFDVGIYDMNGGLRSQKQYSGEKFTIPIHNLKDGNYIVKINNSKTTSSKQLIIKR